MERAKQVLAFPMFGAAVWLVWVLSVQTGSMGTVALLSVFVALGFAIWAWRQGMGWRVAGAVLLIAVAATVWTPLTTVETRGRSEVAAGEEAWSPARVAELQAAGTPVFVNFTAAWCVTCKANEAVALSRPAVKQAFTDNGVVVLKADWTARDSVIADALASHGRNGVPLYLFYAPGAQSPVVLPQLLSEDIVLDTVGRSAGAVRGDLSP
jgi:thiol:disulfide interchange protein DsbD